MTRVETTTIHVLWARMAEHSPSHPTPQFVAAFADGEVDAWPESYEERRREVEEWFRGFSDDPTEVAEFFTTIVRLERPTVPAAVDA